MGIVYKAEDTRLGRPVALKFVSDELSRDPEALSRFAREARTASALNHPNICTIHDIGEQSGRSFIVMEYLRGHHAAGSARRGFAEPEYAARRGHPDCRRAGRCAQRGHHPPRHQAGEHLHRRARSRENARFRPRQDASAGHTQDVTTVGGTRQGVVMGTAAYMAPEQARGEAVDQRADIWSLGLVLYEMVKGDAAPAGRPAARRGRDRLRRLAVNTSWGCALPTARPGTSSPTSRDRRLGKKMCWACSVRWRPGSERGLANRSPLSSDTRRRSRRRRRRSKRCRPTAPG